MGKNATKIELQEDGVKPLQIIQRNTFSSDSSIEVSPPKVCQKSLDIYKCFVERGIIGSSEPNPIDMNKYQKFASNKYFYNFEREYSL